jgi:hypothetical protein
MAAEIEHKVRQNAGILAEVLAGEPVSEDGEMDDM